MFAFNFKNIILMPRLLNLKLGGKCNLGCSHCHCEPSNFSFNPDIIPYINKQNYQRITFSGGEPLLYINTIKSIVSQLEIKPIYRIVTNGTLLTKEIVNWLNQYDFRVIISYDGSKSNRDSSIKPLWENAKYLKNFGFSVCCYPGNMGFGFIFKDIQELKDKYQLTNNQTPPIGQLINFLHQTDYASNDLISKKDVQDYLDQIQIQLNYLLVCYVNGYPLAQSYLLREMLKKWYMPKKYQYGCKCCNEEVHALTLDGRFLLCPYGHLFIGYFYKGIDFDKVNAFIPARCQSCSIWSICRNTCVANITENECIISKEMNKYFNKRINELNIQEKINKDLEESFYL